VKSTVSRAIGILKQRQLIIRNGKHIGLQKDWEQWQKLAEQPTAELAEQATKVSEPANLNDPEKLADRKLKLAVTQPKLAEQATKASSPLDTQKEDTIQKKLYKRKYGEFNNVLLTDEEYQKLKDRFAQETDNLIKELSIGIESKGYKYKSHYATILNWHRRHKEAHATNRNPRELPKTYADSPAYPDLA